MSLNQIVNPSGSGLNLQCHQIKDVGFLPKVVLETYSITEDDLVSQRMLLVGTASANITFTFPSSATLNTLLPQVGDFLEITIKYRTFGSVTITSVDGLFFVLFNNFYNLSPSNGANFVTYKIGVGRTTIGGSFRIY